MIKYGLKGVTLLCIVWAVNAVNASAAPAQRLGVGFNWGIGYQKFDDERLVGYSEIMDLEVFIDNDLFLLLHTEQQSLDFDDQGFSLSGNIRYNGLGVLYVINDWTAAGFEIGKADLDISGFERSTPYATVTTRVDIKQGHSERVNYRMGLAVKYRMMRSDEFTFLFGSRPLSCFDGAQLVGYLGVYF